MTYFSQIGQHFKDGYLHKNEFKIVYVAPMKVPLGFDVCVLKFSISRLMFIMFDLVQALAAEVTRTFSHRLAPLNMIVKELTGDMQLSKNELEETQVTCPSINFSIICSRALNRTRFISFFLC